jgi:hypothetical protein
MWCLNTTCTNYTVTITTEDVSTGQPFENWGAYNNFTLRAGQKLDNQVTVCVSRLGIWALLEMASQQLTSNWGVVPQVTQITTGVNPTSMNNISVTAGQSENLLSFQSWNDEPGLPMRMTVLKFNLTSFGTLAANMTTVSLQVGRDSTTPDEFFQVGLNTTLTNGTLLVGLYPDTMVPLMGAGSVTVYCASFTNSTNPPTWWFATPLIADAVVQSGLAMSVGPQTFNDIQDVLIDVKSCGNNSVAGTRYTVGAIWSFDSEPNALYPAVPLAIVPPSGPPPPEHVNNGMVVGFVSGGIALGIIVIGGIVYYVRRPRLGYSDVN